MTNWLVTLVNRFLANEAGASPTWFVVDAWCSIRRSQYYYDCSDGPVGLQMSPRPGTISTASLPRAAKVDFGRAFTTGPCPLCEAPAFILCNQCKQIGCSGAASQTLWPANGQFWTCGNCGRGDQ